MNEYKYVCIYCMFVYVCMYICIYLFIYCMCVSIYIYRTIHLPLLPLCAPSALLASLPDLSADDKKIHSSAFVLLAPLSIGLNVPHGCNKIVHPAEKRVSGEGTIETGILRTVII